MKTYILDDFIKEVRHCIDTHKLENEGEYARWLWGAGRELGINEYGVADAANILYTINDFPTDQKTRDGFVKALRAMQNPETGMYKEATHPTIHTTAHCTAALELFDAKPLYECKMLENLKDKEELYNFLEKINWNKPWGGSHNGAGLFVAMTNTDMVDLEWKNWYFDWMWENSDPETGFVVYGEKTAPLHEYMAGGFHYMFNHESEKRPYRYPDKIIDTCLYLMSTLAGGLMLKNCTFIEVDVVYSLSRAMRQSPHRFYEAKKALEDFSEKYVEFLFGIDYEKDDCFNDLHCLFGAMCCLAELQSVLPGKILTSKPLRLVLDRRPFI